MIFTASDKKLQILLMLFHIWENPNFTYKKAEIYLTAVLEVADKWEILRDGCLETYGDVRSAHFGF